MPPAAPLSGQFDRHAPSARHDDAAAALLDWYDAHRRDLPWRAKDGERSTPYHVWLSEIMLQQTTVATVAAYFEKFTSIWPTVHDLAKANRDDVMAAWAGLGYYARARNLHKAAIAVVEDFGGAFPNTEDGLRQLPGVGPYTAAAIAAIAFDQRAVVVDGNIERVTARWQMIEAPLPQAKAEIYAVMDALTPRKQTGHRSGDFAQAMMDLASSICLAPRKSQKKSQSGLTEPLCMICPLHPTCRGAGNSPELYPKKKPKTPRPDRYGTVLVVEDNAGNIVLERRPDDGMLGGLDVFPGSGWADGSSQEKNYPILPESLAGQVLAQSNQVLGQAEQGQVMGRILNETVSHIFSHFRIILTLHHLKFDAEKPALPEGLIWADKAALPDRALPTVMVKVAKAARII